MRTLAAQAPRLDESRPAGPRDDDRLQRLASRFAAALESGDLDTFVSLLTEDVTWTMPPLTSWYQGIDAVAAFAHDVPMTRCPSWRHTVLTANGGQPAIAFYLGVDPGADHTGSGFVSRRLDVVQFLSRRQSFVALHSRICCENNREATTSGERSSPRHPDPQRAERFRQHLSRHG